MTPPRNPLRSFLVTMLLGVAMATGIYLLAEPELAWLGFVLAGMYQASADRGPGCRTRIRSRSARR